MTVFENIIRLQKATPHAYKIFADRMGLIDGTYTIHTRNGLNIELRSRKGDRFVFYEIFSLGTYDVALRYIKPGMTVVDVGANIGLFSLAAAQKLNDEGRILALEPISSTISQLILNVQLNGKKSIKYIQAAVGEQSGTITIIEGDNSLFSSMYSSIDGRDMTSGKTHTVQCFSIYDILESEKIMTCDLLKLDCEGAEHVIIPTLSKEVAERIRAISVEFHRVDGNDSRYLITYLKDLGYRHKFDKTHFFEK